MKRPEGFDGRAAPEKPAAARVTSRRGAQAPAASVGAVSKRRSAPGDKKSSQNPAQNPAQDSTQKSAQNPARDSAAISDRKARANLKAAARKRRRFEKGEVRRFTRRSRTRQTVWIAAVAIVVSLVGVLAVAVYSPILALQTITINGASRVSANELHAALDDQLGTPLALVDFDQITRDLSSFPLIRSFTTQSVPPNTLIVTIVERQPVAAVASATGFDLIDPAGIVVQSTAERVPGIPLVELGDGGTKSDAFASIVEVILALPATVLAQVDSISAQTQDDVTLVLSGVGQSVVWGSADRSDYKARVLSALIADQDPTALFEYDVSAPDSPVVTRR